MQNHVNHPLNIKNLTLKNRLVMPPMATRLTEADGVANDALIQYYRERAKGGLLGLIEVEHCYVDPQGRANPVQMGLTNDAQEDGYRNLAEALHREGVPVFAQINHAGSFTTTAVTGQELVSASAVVHPRMAAKEEAAPRALTREEISRLTEQYALAALRAKRAGCDGVEIHCAHGYLLNQFYSPITNHREDEYGGSLENRLRFACEVIRAVRAAVGEDYPVSFRLGGMDYMPGGSTLEDCVQAGKMVEAEGIDLLSITGGMCGYVLPDRKEPGYFGEMTKALKKELQIPVLLTGGVTEIAQAEALLAEGVADLIGVGRALLKSADWGREQ